MGNRKVERGRGIASMTEIDSVYLNIESVVFFIEDYCAVLSFASDKSETPSSYLILTRPTSKIEGGDPEEEHEWRLSIDYKEEINQLNSYAIVSKNVIEFIFNGGLLAVRLNIKDADESRLSDWLEFIFRN